MAAYREHGFPVLTVGDFAGPTFVDLLEAGTNAAIASSGIPPELADISPMTSYARHYAALEQFRKSLSQQPTPNVIHMPTEG